MSKRENHTQTNENEAVRQAQALQARLAALPTDAPPLTQAQQRALYARALQKAGLAAKRGAEPVSASAAAEASAAEIVASDEAVAKTRAEAAPAKARPRRGRLIRWQRWALGTAAALLVVFGGARLLSGGFASMQLAAPETAAQNEAAYVTDAEPEDAPAELYGAFEDAHSFDTAPGAAEEPTAQQPAAEEVEETAGEMEEFFTEVGLTDESAAQEKDTAGGDDAQAPDADRQRNEADSAVNDGSMAQAEQESAAQDMAQLPTVMVQGRLYYSMGSVLAAEPAGGDLIGSIGSVVPSGTLPQQELQANFRCMGASCARYGSGIALLLEDGWVYFAPVG